MRNRSISALPSFFVPAVPLRTLAQQTPQSVPLEVLDITYLHFHSVMELGVCASGRGSCIVEETKYAFSAGDVQIVFPFQSHLARSEGDEYSRWYWLSINPLQLLCRWGAPDLPRMERLLDTCMGLCGIIDRAKYPLVAELIRRVVLPGEESVRLSCLCTLIEALAEASGALPKLKLRPGQQFLRLSPALELAQQALSEGRAPSVAAMAQACSLSVAPFRRAFHLATGQSPQQYIHACQMKMAQQMLFTDTPVTEIALAVGYQDVSGFNRQFLKTFGTSPRAYRAQLSQENARRDVMP